jgi:phosphate transport system substrate-binding protein
MKPRNGLSVKSAVLALITVVIVVAVVAALIASQQGAVGTSTQPTSMTSSSNTSTSSSKYTPTPGPIVISAGGSTFVNPLMQVWASAYHNLTLNSQNPVSINYQPIGSSAGQQGLFTGTLDFAGSDAPVSQAQLAQYASKGPLLQIPEALGGVAIFYNIPGVNVSLNLTGQVIAKIYEQKITKWNDPSIARLNPSVNLPNQTIIPVHRSDGSGTTYALTSYLATQDPDWSATIGIGTSVNWPTNELAGKGSSGVAGLVIQNKYSIGYADSYYAFNNHLQAANIQNSAGRFVQPTVSSFVSAASQFADILSKNVTASIVNAPGQDSYPIATFTYLLVWQNQNDPNKGWAIVNFFKWVVTSGQTYSQSLYFAPLPNNIVNIDLQLISSINYNGKTFT